MPIDTTPSTVATNALQAIPFSSLIGGPLKAAIDAQAVAAKTTYDFIKEVGLYTDPVTGEKKAVQVVFQFQRGNQMVNLIVPLLAIVPIPYIAVNNITIDFLAKISAEASSVSQTSESTQYGGELSVGGSIWGVSVNFKANYSSKKDSTSTAQSKYSVEYTMAVHVEAGQDSMPAGLAAVLNMLNEGLQATPPDGKLELSSRTLMLAATDVNALALERAWAENERGLKLDDAKITFSLPQNEGLVLQKAVGTGQDEGALLELAVDSSGYAAVNVKVADPTKFPNNRTIELGVNTQIPIKDDAGKIVKTIDKNDRVLVNVLRYVPPPPEIRSVSPVQGPVAGDTNVTIMGIGFAEGAIVRFGGTLATSSNVAAGGTQITATTPAYDPPGPVDIVVTNPSAERAIKAGGFTYQGATPTITVVNPAAGKANTPVTITGTSFLRGAKVTFGNIPADPVDFKSVTTLTVLAPEHADGSVDIVVINPDGMQGTKTGGFEYKSTNALTARQPVIETRPLKADATRKRPGPSSYSPPPKIVSVALLDGLPAVGSQRGGTVVQISGIGFASGIQVYFDDTPALSITLASDGRLIQATTPPHATGWVGVRVTNLDGQSGTLANAFFYEPVGLVINQVSPSEGLASGNTPVTVTGAGFDQGVRLQFGSIDALTVEWFSSTELQAITPPHTAGAVTVTAINSDGRQATLTDGFVFNGPATAGEE